MRIVLWAIAVCVLFAVVYFSVGLFLDAQQPRQEGTSGHKI